MSKVISNYAGVYRKFKSVLESVFRTEFEEAKLRSKLYEDLDIDSLNIYEVSHYLEVAFKIKLSDSDIAECVTLKDLFRAVLNGLKEKLDS